MPIIAHRGAKGLAPENTEKAIKIGASLPVALVEFDVRKTKDNRLVVIHNSTTSNGLEIENSTIGEIQNNDPTIITLKTALNVCKPAPALVEIKSNNNTAKIVAEELKSYKNASVTSFHPEEIEIFRSLDPERECFLMQRKHPFGLVNKAKKYKANGIGFNKNWLILLPFISFIAHKNNLKCYIYTLNNNLLSKIVLMLMPKVYICTDFPDRIGVKN
jgi:glycerophosphoryl diester phosphodiesterase